MIARLSRFALIIILTLGALAVYYSKAPDIKPFFVEPSGILITKLYTAQEILSADIDGDITVYITQEEGPASLRIEADSRILPYIDISIIDKQLIVRINTGSTTVLSGICTTLYLFVADFACLTAHGNSRIMVENELTVDSLDLNTRGNACIRACIHTKQLDVESHGSSKICLKGTTFEQYLDLSGSSRYEAFDLKSQECSIIASGASIAQLCVAVLLHGMLNGSSAVTFLGNPKNIIQKNGNAQLTQKADEQKEQSINQ